MTLLRLSELMLEACLVYATLRTDHFINNAIEFTVFDYPLVGVGHQATHHVLPGYPTNGGSGEQPN